MPPIIKKTPPKKPAASKPAPKPSASTAARKDRDFVPAAKGKTPQGAAPKPAAPKAPASKLPTAKDAPPVQKAVSLEEMGRAEVVRPYLEGKTKQDIINVIYKAAEDLKMPPWSLLKKAKLEHLVDDRKAPYTGPAIAFLPNLTSEEKSAILKVLKDYVRPKK